MAVLFSSNTSSLLTMAQARTSPSSGNSFNPWDLPDSFTVLNFAPEEIRPFLHPHWHNQKAPHPMLYYFFGLYYLVVGTIAIGGNTMVLRIYSKFQALRTPANLLVMNLAFTDLVLMVSLIPECVYNFFCGGPWQFGEMACQIHSFCGIYSDSHDYNIRIISWKLLY